MTSVMLHNYIRSGWAWLRIRIGEWWIMKNANKYQAHKWLWVKENCIYPTHRLFEINQYPNITFITSYHAITHQVNKIMVFGWGVWLLALCVILYNYNYRPIFVQYFSSNLSCSFINLVTHSDLEIVPMTT